MGQIKGKSQNLNEFKYLLYLYSFFHTYGIYPPFTKVGIKSYKMLEDFKMTCWSKVLNQYQGKGTIGKKLLTVTDKSFKIGKKSQRYSLNINNYIKLIEKYEDSSVNQKNKLYDYLAKDLQKPIQKYLPIKITPQRPAFSFYKDSMYKDVKNNNVPTNVSKKYVLSDVSLTGKLSEEPGGLVTLSPTLSSNMTPVVHYVYPIYCDKVEYIDILIYYVKEYMLYGLDISDTDIVNLYRELPDNTNIRYFKSFYEIVEKLDIEYMSSFYFPTNNIELTEEEIAYYRQVYRNYLSESVIIEYLLEEKKHLDRLRPYVRLKINTTFERHLKGYYVKTSFRQYNPDTLLKKDQRHTNFSEYGINDNFDLHSAIFAVTRLMNTGVFDPDWDVKAELLKTKEFLDVNGNPITRNDLKGLTMRMYFELSYNLMYSHYKRKITKDIDDGDNLVVVSKETFIDMAKTLETLVGDEDRYNRTIFAIESLLEMKVLRWFFENNLKVKNVYDCFYFDSKEIEEKFNIDDAIELVKKTITKKAKETYKQVSKAYTKGNFAKNKLW